MAWSSTSTSPATALSSSITTPCSIARRARRGPLKDRTAGELAAFDVPPLRDVLARYPKIGVIIELKERGAELARGRCRRGAPRRRERSRVPGIVQRHRAARGARARRRRLRRAALDSKCGWRCIDRGAACHLAACRIRRFRCPKSSGATRVVSPRFVQLAHKAGIAVQVWTVDEPEDIRRLLDWGVDGIISDRPDVAAEVVRDWVGRSRSTVQSSRAVHLVEQSRVVD